VHGVIRTQKNISDHCSWLSVLVEAVGLLHELVPNSAILALLVNPKYPSAESEISETRAASRACTLRRWNERTLSQSVAANSSPDRVYLFGKAMLEKATPTVASESAMLSA
jgi:hypothetical protein